VEVSVTRTTRKLVLYAVLELKMFQIKTVDIKMTVLFSSVRSAAVFCYCDLLFIIIHRIITSVSGVFLL